MQRGCQSALTFYGTTLLDHWMHLNVIATVYVHGWILQPLVQSCCFSHFPQKHDVTEGHVGVSTNQRQERPATASKQDWTASNNGWKLKTLCRKICRYCDIIWNLRTLFFPKEMYSGGAPKTNLVFHKAVAWDEQTVWPPFIHSSCHWHLKECWSVVQNQINKCAEYHACMRSKRNSEISIHVCQIIFWMTDHESAM